MAANKIRCVGCGATLSPWEDAYQWENAYIALAETICRALGVGA